MRLELSRRVSELLEIARASQSREAFRRDALGWLRPLLGFDGATWVCSAGGTADMFTWHIPLAAVERSRDHAAEYAPAVERSLREGPQVELGLSEAARRRSGLWNEVFRPLGITSVIAASLGGEPRPLTLLTLCRDGHPSAFDDRGAEAVHALTPVLELGEDLAASREHSATTPPSGLTRREHEIVALVARGLTNDDIARILHISKNTVRNRLAAALERTGTSNRAEIAARFFRGA